MNNKSLRYLLIAASLTLAVLACQVPSLPGSDTLLTDDFSDSSQWGTGTDENSSVEYLNDALAIAVLQNNYFVWNTPDDTDYENVHIETTVTNSSSDSTGAFGIVCNLQVTDTSYYFAVTGAGEYAIGKYTLLGDELLTNGGQWEKSDAITPGADSYRLGADCGGDGTLTLYVDGKQVDSVNDTTYASGGVGVFAWSGEQPNATSVSFDDFKMTEIK